MLEIFTTSQRQYLAQRVKPFVLQEGVYTYLDKITSFVKFWNQNRCPQFTIITWRSCRRAFFF
jgi:hypothetical protein